MKYQVTLKSETILEVDAADQNEAIKTAVYYPMYSTAENIKTISDVNTVNAEKLQEE